jgi:hypothetical protein
MAHRPPIPSQDLPFALAAIASLFVIGLLFAGAVVVGLVMQAL